LKYHTSLAPFEIRNVFDFLWWVNFTMKWQYVGLRMFTRYDNVERQTCRKRIDSLKSDNMKERQDQEKDEGNQFRPLNKDTANNLMHFYDSMDFQRWAMNEVNHRHLKLPKTKFRSRKVSKDDLVPWSNYKMVLKAYLLHDETWLPLICGAHYHKYSIRNYVMSAEVKLFQYWDRKQYFRDKIKEGSLQHKPADGFAMDEDFNIISFGGFSTNPEAMYAKYGTSLKRYLK